MTLQGYLVLNPIYNKRNNEIEQPCWKCTKSAGGCSWSRRFEPVEGWDAMPTSVNRVSPNPTFVIRQCPEFDLDTAGGRWSCSTCAYKLTNRNRYHCKFCAYNPEYAGDIAKQCRLNTHWLSLYDCLAGLNFYLEGKEE